MVAAAPRRQGRRDDARPGQQGKEQGAACGLRPGRRQVDRAVAGKAPRADRPLGQAADRSAPPRRHHARAAADEDGGRRQSGRAADGPVEGRVRAGRLVSLTSPAPHRE